MLLVSGTVPSPLCSLAHEGGGQSSHACSSRARGCVSGEWPLSLSLGFVASADPCWAWDSCPWEHRHGLARDAGHGAGRHRAAAPTGRDGLGTCTACVGLCPGRGRDPRARAHCCGHSGHTGTPPANLPVRCQGWEGREGGGQPTSGTGRSARLVPGGTAEDRRGAARRHEGAAAGPIHCPCCPRLLRPARREQGRERDAQGARRRSGLDGGRCPAERGRRRVKR